MTARPINCGTGHCSCIECLFEADAKPEPFTPDWSQDSAAAESIREHQAICNLLLKEMRHIAGISTGQVKRVAEQALEAVKQAQPERAPLTQEQIEGVCVEVHLKRDFITNLEKFVAIARAIEAAHGIKQGGQHD